MSAVGYAEKKLRICIMTSVHPALDVRIFQKQCLSLAKAGYEVSLIACHHHDEIVDGIQIRAVPIPRSRWSRMTGTVWQIYRTALRQDAQVYHFHDPELIPLGLLLRIRGKKVIYDVHEDLHADLAFKYYVPRSLRVPIAWIVSLLEGLASHYFSAVVPATSGIGKRFSHLNGHTVVIRNFPRLEDFPRPFEAGWTRRSPAVAFVGSISQDRGIREMVQAMALLPEDLQASLQLAGRFVPEKLREEMAEINGWNRVRFLGFLGRAQVAELLADVSAGVVTLRPTPGFLQSAPTKMFEYMNAGIPVIASDFPAFREIVDTTKCGLLVDPLDPRAIAKAIEYILRHPEESEQMGRRGREAVETYFNWAREEPKLLTLYDILMKQTCAA